MKTIQEQYQEHLVSFRAIIKDMVKDMVKEHGGVDPVVFALILKDNKVAIGVLAGLGELFTSDQGKDLAAEAMKKLNEEIKPIAIAFVSEAWASIKAEGEYDSVIDPSGNYREGVVRPADDPNRKEMIFINWETFDQQAMDTWEMVRNGDDLQLKKAHTDDWKPKDPKTKSGRFTNILTDNYSELAKILGEQLKNSQN
jgi:hypothetical protein